MMKKLNAVLLFVFVEILVLGCLVIGGNVQSNTQKIAENHENGQRQKESKNSTVKQNENVRETSDKNQNEWENKSESKDLGDVSGIREELRKLLEDEGKELSEAEIESILKEEAISVFKVNCSSIKGDLSFRDKTDMAKVALKVDFKLYGTIKELLYHKNQEYGVLKSLILLRENLSDKDYKVVERIAGRYVDMNKVEEYYFMNEYKKD